MAADWTQKPLRKVTFKAGQTWSYRLPLAAAGGQPTSVSWDSDVLPQSAFMMSDDRPLELTVHVPADLPGTFGEISYDFELSGEKTSGKIIFCIQPGQSAESKDAPERRTGQTSPGIRDLGAAPDTVPIQPEPAAARPPEQPKRNPPPHATADQQIHSSTGASPLTGSYQVEVLRQGDVPVPGLTRPVVPGRTLSIGRSSSSKGVPDLDLKGQFESTKLEEYCSRAQVEVLWFKETIVVKTVGRWPLRFLQGDGAPGGEVPHLHNWEPGQILCLPGKLRIVLREERP